MNPSSPHSPVCQRCHAVPKKFDGNGQLYLWFPTQHTLGKVTAHFQRLGLECQLIQQGNGLSAICSSEQIHQLVDRLSQDTHLSKRELQETQALFREKVGQPHIEDFSEVTSLHRFLRLNQSDWLIELLEKHRFTSYFQPIVDATQPNQIFAHEALLRGINPAGELIPPGAIFALAKDAGLLPQVDLAARYSAIRGMSQYNLQTKLFINFSPTAIYDPVACLRETVKTIDEVGMSHQNIVFEVIESDQPQNLEHLQGILKYYRNAGFLVALDDLGSGYSSLNLIHQLRPDFIKLDMELIRNVHQDPYKALITEKILEITQTLEIKTVAEGVESPEELNWLQSRGATFVQGYLIAKPSATPTFCLGA